ncbi:hypothetical protein T440DRAFT_518939 [Plenodomus tracheiphilus IPT5]|uniref:Uncharacterized protein n=1 Tax=Plenodomus tracheiphilus IPT5 TaxID=1408161 RepID=A0A6A7B2J1_9PLEO|nr:hypothetical protein T440DRAFT_518939 [Plenodomus tracheiphilus IPT5]
MLASTAPKVQSDAGPAEPAKRRRGRPKGRLNNPKKKDEQGNEITLKEWNKRRREKKQALKACKAEAAPAENRPSALNGRVDSAASPTVSDASSASTDGAGPYHTGVPPPLIFFVSPQGQRVGPFGLPSGYMPGQAPTEPVARGIPGVGPFDPPWYSPFLDIWFLFHYNFEWEGYVVPQ